MVQLIGSRGGISEASRLALPPERMGPEAAPPAADAERLLLQSRSGRQTGRETNGSLSELPANGEGSGSGAGSDTILHPLMGFTSKRRGASVPCCPHGTSVKHSSGMLWLNCSRSPSSQLFFKGHLEPLHCLSHKVSWMQDMGPASPTASCCPPRTIPYQSCCPRPRAHSPRQACTPPPFLVPFPEVQKLQQELEEHLVNAFRPQECRPPPPGPACLRVLAGDKHKPAFRIAPQ